MLSVKTIKTALFALFRKYEFQEPKFQEIDAVLYHLIFCNGDFYQQQAVTSYEHFWNRRMSLNEIL